MIIFGKHHKLNIPFVFELMSRNIQTYLQNIVLRYVQMRKNKCKKDIIYILSKNIFKTPEYFDENLKVLTKIRKNFILIRNYAESILRMEEMT